MNQQFSTRALKNCASLPAPTVELAPELAASLLPAETIGSCPDLPGTEGCTIRAAKMLTAVLKTGYVYIQMVV